MISRPTTDQLILECCRHLLEDVVPHVADDAGRERLVMIETILRNTAVRAAHEIAWMTDEIESVAVLCPTRHRCWLPTTRVRSTTWHRASNRHRTICPT